VGLAAAAAAAAAAVLGSARQAVAVTPAVQPAVGRVVIGDIAAFPADSNASEVAVLE
jgi:hypothetical protein